MSRSLGAIVDALGGELHGSRQTLVARLAPLATAEPADLAFIAQERYASQLQTTRAGALIVPPILQDVSVRRGPCIVTNNPYLYFARLTQWWRSEHEDRAAPAIDPLSSVHPTAQVADGWTLARSLWWLLALALPGALA